MTPTTTLATIADHDFKSSPSTTAEIASPTTLASAYGRDPRTVEALSWLTERLNWEDRLAHLRERHAENCNADLERR